MAHFERQEELFSVVCVSQDSTGIVTNPTILGLPKATRMTARYSTGT